ncbi:MAG: PIG-L family deacetylase [Spirochaetaceae bacterium]|nr:MAG: PIG-L family deacetylase [Spirochaetaceae bacterium]
MKRVLAFGCHPDDIEYMVAGTLLLLAGKGWEIHLATMTGGEVGSSDLKRQEIQDKRLKEAAAAAEVIGATYHYAGGHDLEVEYNHHYRQLAVRVVRRVNPDIILTHAPTDYLIDHEETSRLVRNAAFIAPVPLYDCGLPLKPADKIPHLYYWDAFGGTDNFGRPLPIHFGIDVTTAMASKERMLACHESQREWLRYINKFDAYLEDMKEKTRAHGQRIGRPYGECFIQHVGNGHPTDNILKTILGDLCVELSKKA